MKEIIKCKDCRWFNPYKAEGVSKGDCLHYGGMCKTLKPSDYCSLAERVKETEEES